MDSLDEKMLERLSNRLKSQLQGKGTSDADTPIWRVFLDLNETRPYGPYGPQPITFTEILAYCSLMKWPLESRHIAIIRKLDRIFLESTQEPSQPSEPLIELAPEIFDAVF